MIQIVTWNNEYQNQWMTMSPLAISCRQQNLHNVQHVMHVNASRTRYVGPHQWPTEEQ